MWTMLIDLDDTLLKNDMGTFIPAYLNALAEHMQTYIDGNRWISTLLQATQKMQANQHPGRTLKQVFDQAFYPALGIAQQQIAPAIDQFYTQIFPTLRRLTEPIPEAVALIESLIQRGAQVVIATNPLFPRTAILQRLDWAGLSVDHYPFALVPSYETFHFAKPNPVYYAELLSHLGWPEGAVVMIGNEQENDILAAQRAGLATFWVNGDPSQMQVNERQVVGRLDGVLPWLDSQDPQALTPEFDKQSALLATLRATPAALFTMAEDLDLSQMTRRPEPKEWCLTETLCHLRDVEQEVNLSRLQRISSEKNPFITGVDTDPWAEERNYRSQDGWAALQAFCAERMKTLELLSGLTEEQWQLVARHTFLGPIHLQELVSIIAAHDRLHLRQAINCLKAT